MGMPPGWVPPYTLGCPRHAAAADTSDRFSTRNSGLNDWATLAFTRRRSEALKSEALATQTRSHQSAQTQADHRVRLTLRARPE